MMIPTVHLNGTSKEALVEQLCNVSNALEAVFQALRQATPNGRDYYPQGNTALEEALKEHFVRQNKVDALKKEIDALAEAVDQGGQK